MPNFGMIAMLEVSWTKNLDTNMTLAKR